MNILLSTHSLTHSLSRYLSRNLSNSLSLSMQSVRNIFISNLQEKESISVNFYLLILSSHLYLSLSVKESLIRTRLQLITF